MGDLKWITWKEFEFIYRPYAIIRGGRERKKTQVKGRTEKRRT